MSCSPAQYTAETWEAVAWNCHAATTVKAGDIVIAECSGFGRYADESLADARLIAAAPDLLRALCMLLDRTGCDYYPIEHEMARAAIAKAQGGAS